MSDAPIIHVKNFRFSPAIAAAVALAIQAGNVLGYEIDPDSTIADSPMRVPLPKSSGRTRR